MIGGGMKTLSQSRHNMESVLPKKAKWIKDAVAQFNPDANEVVTRDGHVISYDIIVIAMGLQLNYGEVMWNHYQMEFILDEMKDDLCD